MTTTADTKALIEEMTARIVREFDPLQVILFGSHARGDAGSDSDIDLLVVLAEVADRRATTIGIRDILADMPIAKDIIVATPDDIRRASRPSVLGRARDEGRVVHGGE